MKHSPSPMFLPTALALLLLLLLALTGCAGHAVESLGPAPTAIATGCEPPQDLVVPTGLNSQQLEEVLYAAYLDWRASMLACVAGQELNTP